MERSVQAKARGITAFTQKDFNLAVEEFTEAIDNAPQDHALYSNRSAAYASLGKFELSLADANKCLECKPDFVKAFIRKAIALENLGRFEDAILAYEEGLRIDPNNEKMKSSRDILHKKVNENPLASLFGPDMWAKLYANPKTAEMLKDPETFRKVSMLQADPNALNSFVKDPQMLEIISVILGINMQRAPPPESAPEPQKPSPSKPKPVPVPKPAEVKVSPEEQKKLDATKKKDEGNIAYKSRDYSRAIELYDEAIEIDDKNPTFLTNKAAVYLEMGEYDKAIEQCDLSIKVAKEHPTEKTFEAVAKAYFRIGNVLAKQGKYDEAIEYFDRSLLEAPNKAVKKARKECEIAKQKADGLAYINPELAMEAKNKADDLVKDGKYPEAVTLYDEAIKRDPKLVAAYSNRAMCFIKLMDWQKAVSDCDKCLEIDPKFWKAYLRKGKIEHLLKRFDKAIEFYDKGLALDNNNAQLIEAKQATSMAINTSSGQVDQERARRAMEDPEIQAIIQDPAVKSALQTLSSDPQAAQTILNDPVLAAKIQKLIASGVLQVQR